MVKMKVYELAKEMDVDSKEVIRVMKKYGYEAKSHMSIIEEESLERIKSALTQKGATKAPAASEDNPVFVPKVKRIPKAQIIEEKAQEEVEAPTSDLSDIAPEEAAPAAASVRDKEVAEVKTPAAPLEKAPDEQPFGLAAATPAESEVKNAPPVLPPQDAAAEQSRQVKEEAVKKAAPTPEVKAAAVTPTAAKPTYSRPPRDNAATAGNTRPYNANSKPYNANPKPYNNNTGSPRPATRPTTAAGSRPQGGYRKPDDKDGASRPAYNQGNKPKPANKYIAMPEAPQTVIEKPTGNYRPEKKNFTKDKIFERVSKEDNIRSQKFDGNKARGKGRNDKMQRKAIMPPVALKKIVIGESIVLGELAKAMGKTAAEVIKKLFEMGVMATINQELDADTAILIANEFGATVEVKADRSAEIMEDIDDTEDNMMERPPIVTVMGHVDHGKTSLLDAIRKTNVIATEAGGITQHIGAYQVEIKNRKITFLDTPGHEAFTAMRARGAQITDIAIIVVAADDGVMPQTIEAINHSKAAGVPMIIAINKMDKEDANSDRVKQELTEQGLLPEEWGGDTIMVPVSAKKGQGIEQLLEMILLVAEVAELKANPDRQARGTVVEAQLDKARGPVVTLLVQKGTLNVGDTVIAGPVFGKIRAMNDDKGRKIRSAGPSVPVEVMGFSDVPSAGEVFIAVEDERDARMVAAKKQVQKREDELHKSSKVSLDDLFKQISDGEIKELNIIIKADVHGSIEAIQQSMEKLNTDEVKVNIIHSGVGGIRETDVMLASASNAIIIGFNVRPDAGARKSAETESVDIRLYRVIYDAIEDIKKAMTGLLAPEFKENLLGHAQVRTLFKVPRVGIIAGCYVTDGKITRSALVRVIRDHIVITEGKIESLRRFKDDVKEVATGYECGIGIENFNDIKEDDVIEAYSMEEIEREL